jgi:small subunit ribosomal protein S5
VGVGLGKANEVPQAIQKSFEAAKKRMIKTVIVESTIPFEVNAKFGAGKVLLKPAAPGTGIIAGGAVRAVVEAAGVKNILSKSTGSNNPVNVLRATISALKMLKTPDQISKVRGRSVGQIYKA